MRMSATGAVAFLLIVLNTALPANTANAAGKSVFGPWGSCTLSHDGLKVPGYYDPFTKLFLL